MLEVVQLNWGVIFRNAFFALFFGVLFSCQSGSRDVNQARQRLLTVKRWKINEIYVDDAIRYKDGKLLPDFGGVDFERYMESVAFTEQGFFEGYFKGETEPLKLKYTLKPDTIVLSDADPKVKSGEWVIVPSGVTDDSFEMSTITKAYNYPATTTVRLLFTADQSK